MILIRLSACIFVWAVAHARDAYAQAKPTVDQSLVPYANTNDDAKLADGRTIHLVCMGQGSPVVILTAGGGDWSIVWNKVQSQVARQTRVCAWDRAGFGLSPPSPRRQTVDNRTSDLQAALKAKGILGPYVLVGHSLGGLESLLFKDREPNQVVGMVLVDSGFPDSAAVIGRVAPNFVEWVRRYSSPELSRYERCATGVRTGTVGYGKPDPDGCTKPSWPETYPAELAEALTEVQFNAGPERLAAIFGNLHFFANSSIEDGQIAIQPNRHYGAMPLIVLAAGDEPPPPPDVPAAVLPELPKQAAEWRRAQGALAALSTRGVSRVIKGSAHYIHQTKPQVVSDAIDEIVDAARADAAARPTSGAPK